MLLEPHADDPQAMSASVAAAASRGRKRVPLCINSAVAAGARTRQRIRARHSRDVTESRPGSHCVDYANLASSCGNVEALEWPRRVGELRMHGGLRDKRKFERWRIH